METLLVLDAMDPELLVLDDGAYLTRLGSVEDSEGDGRAAGVGDATLDELLAHTDASALVLSSDVLPVGDVDAPSSDSELDELLLRASSLPPPPPLIPVSHPPVAKPSSDRDAGSDSTSSSQSEPKATPPPRRRRQKDELDYLRSKATELSGELQRLKAREELGERGSGSFVAFDGSGAWSSRPAAELAPPGSSSKKLLWRRVARSQLESRRRVQRENEKLKEMVQGQLEVIQGLEKVLQKRAAMEVRASCWWSWNCGGLLTPLVLW